MASISDQSSNTQQETAKATPGPWSVGGYRPTWTGKIPDSLAVWPNDVSQGTPICLIAPLSNVTENDEANAHLIAAAPDLYAALQLVREQLLKPMDRSWPGTMSINARKVGDAIDAAIAKADGRAEQRPASGTDGP